MTRLELRHTHPETVMASHPWQLVTSREKIEDPPIDQSILLLGSARRLEQLFD